MHLLTLSPFVFVSNCWSLTAMSADEPVAEVAAELAEAAGEPADQPAAGGEENNHGSNNNKRKYEEEEEAAGDLNRKRGSFNEPENGAAVRHKNHVDGGC